MVNQLNLKSETPLNTENLKLLNSLIQELWNSDNQGLFHTPVEHKKLGLHDYLKIIKKPMDLSLVKKNIEKKVYGLVEEIIFDLMLIWQNCKKYNINGSFIYNYAQEIEDLMLEQIEKQMPFVQFGSDVKIESDQYSENQDDDVTSSTSEFNEKQKKKLQEDFKKLNAFQIGDLIKIIKQQSPECFIQIPPDSSKKFQIKLDDMSFECYQSLRKEIHEKEFNNNKIKKVKI